jgi:hypothetical protein
MPQQKFVAGRHRPLHWAVRAMRTLQAHTAKRGVRHPAAGSITFSTGAYFRIFLDSQTVVA